MDATEFRAAVKKIHRQCEAAIDAARERQREELAELALQFANSPEESAPAKRKPARLPTSFDDSEAEENEGRQAARRKLRRGEIDQLLKTAMPDSEAEVTSLDVKEELETRYPDREFNRSTVYGGLERLVEAGKLEVAEEGGRGGGNLRTYRLPRQPAQGVEVTE